MTFYEWLIEDESTYNVDDEYYMMKAWNAAVQSCMNEAAKYIEGPGVILTKLEALKQDEQVF